MTTLSPQDLTAIRHSLLYQFAPHPVTASDLWKEMETSAVLMPTGEELVSFVTNLHKGLPAHHDITST